MKITVFGAFEVEGEPAQLATFAFCLVESIRIKHEMDEDRKAADWLKQYGNLTFEELMKREQEENGEE